MSAETNVQHNSQADDLWARFKVPEWGVFCHTARLRNSPPRLKLVLSDSASQKARKNFARGVLRTKRVNRKVKLLIILEVW